MTLVTNRRFWREILRNALFAHLCLIFLCGCASVRHATPSNLLDRASIYGMKDVRAFSGSSSEGFQKDLLKLIDHKKPAIGMSKANEEVTYSTLALSGGAANGAYGAGLLNGWTIHGNRPVFTIVTGISTGAIIAPFAFLGSDYDAQLKEFYTKYSTKDILRSRPASAQPLENLINHYVTEQLLKDIAVQYKNGRRLYVGTTNLDAQRLVIWDMGKIALAQDEKALKLFRKIILASASFPIAFPPVYLNAEADGKTYDEMHVDGGVTKQVFFLYDVLQGIDEIAKQQGQDLSKRHYRIYIIRNGYANAVWREVPDQLSEIAKRSLDTMINAQSVGDIYQLYVFARASKGDFNLAYIPETHIPQDKELFDPKEMKALYDLGYKEASAGYSWKKTPPGLTEENYAFEKGS